LCVLVDRGWKNEIAGGIRAIELVEQTGEAGCVGVEENDDPLKRRTVVHIGDVSIA
jgi:hypothetical protein